MSEIAVSSPPAGAVPASDDPSDRQLMQLWLHGRSPHTQRAYAADAGRFLAWAGKPLAAVTLADLQGFADSLDALELAGASVYRILSAIKSLFAFGHRLGYLPFDVGRALRLPALRSRLSQRILPETDIHRMLNLERNERNRNLLLLLYSSGARVTEVCRLCWRDIQVTADSAHVSLFGKGGKTRTVKLPTSVAASLVQLRGSAADDEPIFLSRKHQAPLQPAGVLGVVRAAADRAGITAPVSPHWLRHSHASHALDRGAPIHLVQATLGHTSIATTGRYLHARPKESSSTFLGL